MRTALRRRLLYLGFGPALLVVTAFCSAQESTPPNPSLGDLARQIQAERAQEKSHPLRVYTNDDFPLRLSSEAATTQSGPELTAKPSGTQNGPPRPMKCGPTPGDCETYYRSKVRQLRGKLAADQEMLQDTVTMIRQLWDPTGIWGFYTGEETPFDKGVMLHEPDQSYQYQQLKATRASIDADKKAISDLEDQCRRDGCLPGWLR